MELTCRLYSLLEPPKLLYALTHMTSWKCIYSNVRSILEYAIQAWQDIPEYLSDRIAECIQKRALQFYILNAQPTIKIEIDR